MQIEQSDQRAAQALSQKEVLTHMLERYRRESSDLEARVGEGAKARERLSDDIRAQANVLRQLKGDIHVRRRRRGGRRRASSRVKCGSLVDM
jgi:septal ring factor EnvC (AmiA/AmiB activator)